MKTKMAKVRLAVILLVILAVVFFPVIGNGQSPAKIGKTGPPVISFNRGGELVCAGLKPGSPASIQYSLSCGQGSNDWLRLYADLTVSSDGLIRTNVPMAYGKMFFRVKGEVVSLPPPPDTNEVLFGRTENGLGWTNINGAITITGYLGPFGSVVIPEEINGHPVVSIGKEAFNTGFLSGVTIPNSVTNIVTRAFYGCGDLASITIPNSVTSIEATTFAYCTKLASITIPNSVTSIGADAFFKCVSLTSITIPASVTILHDGAFVHCDNLTSIYFEGDAPITEGALYGGTVYYKIGTRGWGLTYDGRPTLPWFPAGNP